MTVVCSIITIRQIFTTIKRRTGSCYICGEFERTYDRYLSTFFYLWKEDSAFRETVLKGKGFCLPHFGDLMAAAERNLSGNELQEFCDRMIDLTELEGRPLS